LLVACCSSLIIMKNFFLIFQKEFRSYFNSPIAFVVITIFLILSGYFFHGIFLNFSTISFQVATNAILARQNNQLNVTEMVVRPFFDIISMVMLIMLPMLTMRMFSEEKKSGTIELLLTYPVKDSEVILGKFAGCMGIFTIMVLLTVPCFILIGLFGEPELGVVLSGYVGLFCMGAAFISLGIFASSITENQIIAAVLSFASLLIFLMMGYSASFASESLGNVLKYLSFMPHMYNSFAKGVLDTEDIIYYVLFTLFCIFLNMRSLESKKWRG